MSNHETQQRQTLSAVKYVIHSQSEGKNALSGVGGAFWSRTTGWGSLDAADRFSTWERMDSFLPISTGGDSEWMLIEEAYDRASKHWGEVGKHDWCIGDHCGDGYMVFVDDRPVSYRPTVELARQLALNVIADLQADGDYRLNDKPQGFVPPKRNRAQPAAHRHAVIRFKRDCQFPRFSMKAGERWGFQLSQQNQARLDAIRAGERFAFAGGQCLAEDVEIIYEGPGNFEYAIAAGHVTDPLVIANYRENPARWEPQP